MASGFRVLTHPSPHPGESKKGFWGEHGAQSARTTAGSSSLENRGTWPKIGKSKTNKSFATGFGAFNHLPAMLMRDKRISMPPSTFPFMTPLTASPFQSNDREGSIITLTPIHTMPTGGSHHSGCNCGGKCKQKPKNVNIPKVAAK